MATEGNTLIAACRGAQQMVLIGDQCQLPPVIKTRVHPPPLAVSTVIGSQTHGLRAYRVTVATDTWATRSDTLNSHISSSHLYPWSSLCCGKCVRHCSNASP